MPKTSRTPDTPIRRSSSGEITVGRQASGLPLCRGSISSISRSAPGGWIPPIEETASTLSWPLFQFFGAVLLSALLDWPRSGETRSSFRKWVGVLGKGALHIDARIVVRTG
jgi:hypothetical protein